MTKDRKKPLKALRPKRVGTKEAKQVKGGSLNAYFESVTGEKQGKYTKKK